MRRESGRHLDGDLHAVAELIMSGANHVFARSNTPQHSHTTVANLPGFDLSPFGALHAIFTVDNKNRVSVRCVGDRCLRYGNHIIPIG